MVALPQRGDERHMKGLQCMVRDCGVISVDVVKSEVLKFDVYGLE